MKVLVLGCGEMGGTAVRDLYNYSEFKEIIVGTRGVARTNSIISELKGKKTKLEPVKLDVNDTRRLESQMRNVDVVVNCVGPNYKYEVKIAKAAIKARVNLIDINDDYTTTLEMMELDEKARAAGILIVLGMGASPGINNVFVRAASERLDEIEEIHTAWVMSGSDPGGLALSYHLLYSLSNRALTYQDGELVEVESFVDGEEKIEFPEPVGSLTVFHVGHPEPITLSRYFKAAKIINNKATFIPSFLNDWIINLGKWALERRNPIKMRNISVDPMDLAAAYFRQACKSMTDVRREGALRTVLKGTRNGEKKKVEYASAGLISNGTGMPASIAAQMLMEGKVAGKGVLAPEECVDWREFLDRIVSRGIGRLDIKEE